MHGSSRMDDMQPQAFPRHAVPPQKDGGARSTHLSGQMWRKIPGLRFAASTTDAGGAEELCDLLNLQVQVFHTDGVDRGGKAGSQLSNSGEESTTPKQVSSCVFTVVEDFISSRVQ